MPKRTSKATAEQTLQRESQAEELGRKYAEKIIDFVAAHQGHFSAGLDWGDKRWHCHVFISDITVPLTFTPDNPELADLFMRACGTSHLGPGTRHAIARLQAKAMEVERQAEAERVAASEGAKSR